MSTEPLTLIGALLLGLSGSPHCLGMCGPISCLCSAAARPGKSASGLVLLFNLGRIATYAALGAILGGLGAAISSQWLVLGGVFRMLASLMLLLMALNLLGWAGATRPLERAGAAFWRHLHPLVGGLLPVDRADKALALGALWGMLPCGLIYSALAWASLSGNALQSALVMTCFGLGTLPALLGLGSAQSTLLRQMKRPSARRLLAVFLLGVALLPLLGPQHSGGDNPDSHHSGHDHQHPRPSISATSAGAAAGG